MAFAAALSATVLHLGPCLIIDYAQFRSVRTNPLGRRIWTANSAAGFRVLYEALAIPNDSSDVKRIVQNAVFAFAAACDGRCVPISTARSWHSLRIQRCRDAARRAGTNVFIEYSPNDVRFVCLDLQLSWLTWHCSITVGSSAVVASIANNAALAPFGFLRQVLQIKRAEQSLNTNMHLSNRSVLKRLDINLSEVEALVDSCKVFLVAGNSVKGLGDNHVKLSRNSVSHEPQPPKSIDCGCARNCAIFIDINHGQALSLAMFATQRDLIVDRAIALLVGAKPGIDRGAKWLSVHQNGQYLRMSDYTPALRPLLQVCGQEHAGVHYQPPTNARE
jgi:hypothetical protein